MSMMRAIATFIHVVHLLGIIRPVVSTDIPGHNLLYRAPSLEASVRQNAFDRASLSPHLVRRAPSPQQMGPPSTPPLNEQQFNETATTACLDALDNVQSVVNPSGMAACYNIPFFNATTGTFAADIRLYQVSPPSDGFAGVPTSQYTLEMMIPAATVSSPDRLASNQSTGPNSPLLLQDFRHIGQLDPRLQIDKLTTGDLRFLLIPNITITARSASNGSFVTALSSDTLSYVSGYLMNEDRSPNNITFPDAAAKLPEIVAAATKFVIPGTAIEIFPIGLIVTAIWTGLFFLTVGLGTLGRMQFRDHFQGRVQMDAARKRGRLFSRS
ncbi:hypothetical protein DIZ76_015739 [Coccidioides immitis]|uniref:Uncharacterized protein n=3 Tax=Coccidioides immitis TaxID=5501 RepID=A0A0J8R9B2_COCIT|nr:hypothetical protein CIRG_05131 [Coccidioides immitis RMSCC 2394]KMU81020.1 hypothetical protein CISG_08869 [Coccidioides immitis RMSCC 3703]TPX21776.1 hypothetical protein DIZ76_015739 [Coccidioides immitis]